MARHVRIRLLLIASVMAIAGLVWFSGERPRVTSDHSFHQVEATESMLRASLERARALNEYLSTGQRVFLAQAERFERDSP